MKNKTILIVCYPLDYILISKILDTDYKLETANTPEDVLTKEKSIRYDLLLIDVLFLKAVPEVLEQAKQKGLPVVAISSEPNDARNRKLLQDGCCACYVKPIRQEVFSPFISYWIGRYSSKDV